MRLQTTTLTKRLFSTIVCLVLLVALPGSAEQIVVKPDAGPRIIPDSFFGMHVRYATTRTPWPYVHFSSWRVITPETEWRGLQPNRGLWDFSALDKAIELATDNGVEVLLTLGQTPTWAAARPDEVVPNGPGASSEPADLSDWENYVRTVATRYKGRIKNYELWNEPRFREVDPYRVIAGFTGSARQMVAMARIAKKVLAEIDPSARLSSPAIDAGFTGLPRVKAWLKAGGGDVSDVFAYHFYLRPPERMPELYRQLRKILDTNGQSGKELWNTESGYFVVNPEQPIAPQWPGSDYVFAKVLTPDELAAYVVRAHVLTAAAGLDRFYWYSWDIRNMGLTRGFGREQTVASQAYAQTVRWLRRAAIHGCQSNDSTIWSCELERPGLGKAWLVWDTNGNLDWNVPADWHVTESESISGALSRVANGAIQIGPQPKLLKQSSGLWAAARN
jgi:hypothetical protein